MTRPQSSLAAEVEAALGAGAAGLTRAAALLARIESPRLEIDPALHAIDRIGERAADRLHAAGDELRPRLSRLSALFYGDEGFRGNRERYDDVRNSLLPEVLERRLGIPISLAVIYMAVARRAGLRVSGVAFPGHFLLRATDAAESGTGAIILDPFDGGAELDARGVRALFARHAGDEAAFRASLLDACTPRQIIARMLNNLKRLYVGARSFEQAWRTSDVLVAIDGARPEDVRDRGLLAYHLDDFPGALRDLEGYLAASDRAHEDTAERRQIWEHVTALRRRVASMS